MFYLLFPNIIYLLSSFFNYSNTQKINQVSHEVHYMGFSNLETTTDYVDLNEIFIKVDSNLVRKFYDIQNEFGRPLKIVWGFRDQKTNRKIGGAKNSAHLYGKALDIVLDSASKEDIKRLIRISSNLGILGIGVYRDSRTIHIDIDEKKGRRAWGSDYSSSSIPKWASVEVKEHLNKSDTLFNSYLSVVMKTDFENFKTEKNLKTNTEITKKMATEDISPKNISDTAVYHIMKKGDTIYSLAKNNNTTVSNICELNRISNTGRIRIGLKIRIK